MTADTVHVLTMRLLRVAGALELIERDLDARADPVSEPVRATASLALGETRGVIAALGEIDDAAR